MGYLNVLCSLAFETTQTQSGLGKVIHFFARNLIAICAYSLNGNNLNFTAVGYELYLTDAVSRVTLPIK